MGRNIVWTIHDDSPNLRPNLCVHRARSDHNPVIPHQLLAPPPLPSAAHPAPPLPHHHLRPLPHIRVLDELEDDVGSPLGGADHPAIINLKGGK